MDPLNIKANLKRICLYIVCIALALNCVASAGKPPEGNPGTAGDNEGDRAHWGSSGSDIADSTTHGQGGKSSCSASHSHGVERPLMILSLVDGQIVALDIENAGQQQWSLDAGVGPLLSSSISQFEIVGPEGRYKVIPSLSGGLFRWDGETLEAVPFTAETLLSASFKLNEETVMVGGKETTTFGINARTGQLHYICGSDGCQIYGDEASDDQDIIVVQHTRQTVRAVDQRNGAEKWNFSVGQHDVSFLEGVPLTKEEGTMTEEVMCEMVDDEEHDFDSDAPHVKVDMSAKTVFALGGASGRQLLWSHQLESCIANAWTIQDGIVSQVDLFEPATLGLTDDKPQMTPFFSEASHPMLFVGTHKNQLYVQPSPGTQSEVSQAAWAAYNGQTQAQPQDGSVLAPKVRWRPYAYTSVSRTPLLVGARNSENLRASEGERAAERSSEVSVWNQYPFDNGYYLLHQLTPAYMTSHHIGHMSDTNESEDGGLQILFRVSVWIWWREILGTSVMLTLCVQLFLFFVLRPRRKHLIKHLAEQYAKAAEGEKANQVQDSAAEMSVRQDSNEVQEHKSRYVTDFEHLECLGKGGFGIVFRAKNKVDENSYAVKRITLPNRPEARDKVLREARTLAILDHSGIVRYFNSWLEEPPLGWQDIQDKQFVGDLLTSNELQSSVGTPAFFNKNSELVRNREQFLQQTGGRSNVDPHCKPRGSPILRFDIGDEPDDTGSGGQLSEGVDQKGDSRASGVAADILFPGRGSELSGGFSVGNDFEESGSFSIVFHGTEDVDESVGMGSETDTLSKSTIPDCGGNALSTVSSLEEESNSDQNTGTSLSTMTDVPFHHYGTGKPNTKDYERSESFQIVFEDSGCSDQPQYSDSITGSSKHSRTHSDSSSGTDIVKDSETTGSAGPHDLNANHHAQVSSISQSKGSRSPASGTASTPGRGGTGGGQPPAKVAKLYLYIQMQLCRKETLKDWLRTNTLARDRNKVLHIFHQILEAVSYVHGCGMIHRDLKPSNIFFSVDGHVKVGDFGLVTAIDTSMVEEAAGEEEGFTGLHLHTGKVGTQLYMSPEQVSGQNYDHKVDIFSLGLIFFELFHPFSTQMERITVMCQAKMQDFPNRFTKELPLEAKFAKWLLSHKPDMRPDSEELSESDIYRDLYEDYVPPSTHSRRYRGASNSSR